MEIDEVAARLLRQYWVVIAVCIAVPLVAVGLIVRQQPRVYTADARISTGANVPSTSTESQAIASEVQAIATGLHTVRHALSAAGAKRDPAAFASNNISVLTLGGSQVVDLTVTDGSPTVAMKVASVLASEVTDALNQMGQTGFTSALKTIDAQTVSLAEQRAALEQQVTNDPTNQRLQARLAGVEGLLANFSADRDRLLIQASVQGLAVLQDPPTLPYRPESKALPQKLGLAVLAGLVFGILIASIIEMTRPTVPGAQRVSRRLGAPVLGRLGRRDWSGSGTPSFRQLALKLRLAAAHARVSTVVLADMAGEVEMDDLAASLEQALADEGHADGSPLTGHASGNSLGHPAASGSAIRVPSRAGTLVSSDEAATRQQAWRVYPMGHMTAASGTDATGLLVLAGPATRVSALTTLSDTARAFGWPIIGVVRVRRTRRWRRAWHRGAGSRPVSRAGPADADTGGNHG